MRYVVRPPAPLSLEGAQCAGALEIANAALHYAVPDQSTYKFRAYKRTDVVEALEQAFAHKCAYCETNASAGFPIDVEHYRPKGSVEREPEHPGYWWLAATWANLLPSCADCNRRRKHRMAIPGLTLDQLARLPKQTSGKQNSFPIEGVRATSAMANYDAEVPMLIDPTVTDPGQHIGWGFEGRLSLAVPKSIDGVSDKRGSSTIFTFGLNRQKLVEQRTGLAEDIELEFSTIERILDLAARTTDAEARRDLIAMAMQNIQRLGRRTVHSAPYSAMARELINTQTVKLVTKFESLIPQD